MPESKRKLAAIVFTDIVGFTELSAKNESGAIELLNTQRDLLKPIVKEHSGDWLKEIGDGLLLTFNTIREAVFCSIAIQEAAKSVPELQLRIGIHQGEVVFQSGDVLGDDVNVASRIEPFSAIGGIAISNKVHDAIIREKDFETKYLGKPKLKGVGQEVKVYCIVSHGLPETDLSKVSAKMGREGFQWNLFSVTGAVLTIVGALFWINMSFLGIGIADTPDVPSIAILPFENKGAEEDEFYAYGISSDLIADVTSAGLIRVASLKDIEKLKYQEMETSELAEKLFIRYIAQGTLWKMDSIFQLSMEIFDTKLSKVVYTKRWQTNWTDLATIKNDLSGNILETLEIKFLQDPEEQIVESSPEAYEYYLRAKHKYEKRKTINDTEIARGLLNKAIELDDNLIKAKILFGETYDSVGDYDMAMDFYTSALKQAELNGDKHIIGSSLNKIGGIYINKSNYDQALNNIRRALKINEELGNKSEIGSSFNSIGNIYAMKGDYEKAIEYFKRYLFISEELGDKSKIGKSLNNIAVIYNKKGDSDQALDFYMRSLRISEELDLKSTIALYLNNIGSIYAQKGEYDQALDHFNRALKISEELGDKVGIGRSLSSIGWRYWGEGEYDQALDYYNRTLEIWEELGSKSGIGQSLGSIGGVHWVKGDYFQALNYQSRALAINEELGNKSGIGGNLYNIGVNYIDIGKHDQALNYFSRALKIYEELDNKESIGVSLNGIGIYYYFEGKYEKAIEYLEKSLHLQQKMGDKFFELYTATHLYLAYKQLGKDYNEQEIHRIIKEEKNVIIFEINFRLYELLEDESYLETAYKQIQEKADELEDELKENFLNFPIPKAIIDKYKVART